MIARAAINPEGWRDVLSRLAELLPGTKIMLHAEDARSKGNAGLIYTGFSGDSIRGYVDHYSKINPWTPCLFDMPTMEAKFSDEVLPSESFRNCEFYDDFLLREGEINDAAGVKIFHAPDRAAMVSVHYGDRAAEQYNAEVKPLLQSLAPLLRMALEVNRQLSQTLPHSEIIADLIQGFLERGAWSMNSAKCCWRTTHSLKGSAVPNTSLLTGQTGSKRRTPAMKRNSRIWFAVRPDRTTRTALRNP